MRLRNKREIKKACAFNICVINCISCNGVFGAVIMQRLVDLSRKEVISMKEGIHPEYKECKVTCACGNTFMTRSTQEEIKTDICSACHPFFTGQQKFAHRGGRVEKFKNKYHLD